MIKKAAICALLIITLSGCSGFLNRVKPYEREVLAKDRMLAVPIGTNAEFSEHVYSIREGSQGGLDTFQGGCGCK